MIIIDIGACIGEFINYCIEEYNIENKFFEHQGHGFENFKFKALGTKNQ